VAGDDRLRALAARRRQVIETLQAERCRLALAAVAAVRDSLELVIAALQGSPEALEAELSAIAGDPENRPAGRTAADHPWDVRSPPPP
jgi:hypothetical protein